MKFFVKDYTISKDWPYGYGLLLATLSPNASNSLQALACSKRHCDEPALDVKPTYIAYTAVAAIAQNTTPAIAS